MSFNALAKPSTSPATADAILPADAEDTISSVSWSPTADHLAAASWDGSVRVYDVAQSGTARGLATLKADGPLLSCDWAKDGTMVLTGGADKKTHLLHVATGQTTTLGTHDAPIRSVRFVDVGGQPIVASASWDRTVRFWDARQPSAVTAAATLVCADRVYAMDARAGLLVAATAGPDRAVHLVDLRNPAVFARTTASPLRHQTRAVAVFPDGRGWATTSIEGRCGMNAVNEKDAGGINFTFRCHRDQPDARTKTTKVYAVNDVQFHPVHTTTFTTAGADGTFHFWDRVAHARLKGYSCCSSPLPTTTTTTNMTTKTTAGAAAAAAEFGSVTTTAFNRDGSLFAYAVGYDWSMGYAANTPQYPNRLMLHSVTDADATPKRR